MSQPGSEARIANLEKEYISLGARIEEAAADTAEEFKALRQDIKELDEGMQSSYKSIGDTFEATWADTKATLATKKDLQILEQRLIGEMNTLRQDHGSKLEKIETTQQRQESILQEILDRLPPKP